MPVFCSQKIPNKKRCFQLTLIRLFFVGLKRHIIDWFIQNLSRAQELPTAGFSGDGELSILCGISFNEIGGGHIGLNLHIGMPNDVHQ